jgi:1,4-dihydroxy-2-naphthoyl-CoA hydrolase
LPELKPPVDRESWVAFFQTIHERTALQPLGVELVDIDEGQIILTMPITDAARQPLGLLHGGISMVLAETAASVHTVWDIDLSEKYPVGIEINGTHLRPAREGTVRVVGKLIRRTRSLVFHQVDIYLVETGEHLCTARVTNYLKPVQDG